MVYGWKIRYKEDNTNFICLELGDVEEESEVVSLCNKCLLTRSTTVSVGVGDYEKGLN